MQDTSKGLRYRKEHLECEHYVTNEQAIWGIWQLKAGRLFVKENLKRPTLVFVLEGELNISTARAIDKKVVAGEMFLVPTGDNFYGRAVRNSLFMRCFFTRDIALCNRFSIERLRDCMLPEQLECGAEIALLPIHPLLSKELEITRQVLQTGLWCLHYQRIKLEILFIELRGLYPREDLAALFAPILGEDNDFKDRVLRVYPEVNTAREFTEKLNMSPTGFKRKFQKTIFNLFEPKPEGLPPNSFLDQFDGKTARVAANWKVRKDGGSMKYITGATVTSRAVTQLAYELAEAFRARQQEVSK